MPQPPAAHETHPLGGAGLGVQLVRVIHQRAPGAAGQVSRRDQRVEIVRMEHLARRDPPAAVGVQALVYQRGCAARVVLEQQRLVRDHDCAAQDVVDERAHPGGGRSRRVHGEHEEPAGRREEPQREARG